MADASGLLDRSGSAIVTLGEGVELEVTRGGELRIVKMEGAFPGHVMSLGKATTKRFLDLQSHLERLIIHAVDA